MPRSLSADLKEAIYGQDSDVVLVTLCTISHPGIEGGPVRLAAHPTSIVSRGQTFTAYPFEYSPPEDTDQGSPQASITWDNINPAELIPWLRTITGKAKVTMEFVREDAPDDPEVTFRNWRLMQATYDPLVIQGELAIPDLGEEAYPGDTYSPATAPAIAFGFS